ncbi:MAG: hypothetical protein II077_00635, partial [Treponema sp.]|nr:hypothetical protein [Treponema sp.]
MAKNSICSSLLPTYICALKIQDETHLRIFFINIYLDEPCTALPNALWLTRHLPFFTMQNKERHGGRVMWFAKATFLFVRKEAVKNGKEAIFYRRSGVPRDPTRSIALQPASRA